MIAGELLLLDFHWKTLVTYNPSTEALNCYILTADETELN